MLLRLSPPGTALSFALRAACRWPPPNPKRRQPRQGERASGSPRQPAGGQQRASKGSWDSLPPATDGKGRSPTGGGSGGGFNGCGPAPPPLPVRARLFPSFASLLPAVSPRRWQLSCRCGLLGDMVPPGRKKGKAGKGAFQAGPTPSVSKDLGLGLGLGRPAGRPANRWFAACRWKRKTGRLVGRRESIVKTRAVCTLLESAAKSKVVWIHVLSACDLG